MPESLPQKPPKSQKFQSSKVDRFQVDTMSKAMVSAAHKSSKFAGPQVDEHEVVLNPAAIALEGVQIPG